MATHRLEEAPRLGRAFDVVIDATGSTTGLPTALALVRPCGTVVLKTTVAGAHTTRLQRSRKAAELNQLAGDAPFTNVMRSRI